jgi:hypothetical protein
MTEKNTAAFAWDDEGAGMLRVNGYGGAFIENTEG